MTADSFFFKFPADRAVMIFHEQYEGGAGRIAIVAPTFTPGISHFGVAMVLGREWEFISGPALIHTHRIWRKLLQLEGYCPTAAVWFGETDDWSIPAASPDHFIDLISGKEFV